MTDLFKRIWLAAARHSIMTSDTDTAKACLNYWPSVADAKLEKEWKDLKNWVDLMEKAKERLPL